MRSASGRCDAAGPAAHLRHRQRAATERSAESHGRSDIRRSCTFESFPLFAQLVPSRGVDCAGARISRVQRTGHACVRCCPLLANSTFGHDSGLNARAKHNCMSTSIWISRSSLACRYTYAKSTDIDPHAPRPPHQLPSRYPFRKSRLECTCGMRQVSSMWESEHRHRYLIRDTRFRRPSEHQSTLNTPPSPHAQLVRSCSHAVLPAKSPPITQHVHFIRPLLARTRPTHHTGGIQPQQDGGHSSCLLSTRHHPSAATLPPPHTAPRLHGTQTGSA